MKYVHGLGLWYFQLRSRSCSKMEQFLPALKIEMNSSSTPPDPFSCQFAPSPAKATEQDSCQLPGQISLTTSTAISDFFFKQVCRSVKRLIKPVGDDSVSSAHGLFTYGAHLTHLNDVLIHTVFDSSSKKIIGVFIIVHRTTRSF